MKDLRIFETQDGSHSIFAEEFGVSYHSKYGAIQETQHVFIAAALHFKAVVKKDLRILGMGFGTGLNAYMSYLEAERLNLQLHYTAVEAYPIVAEQWKSLNYAEQLQKDTATFQRFHSSPWNEAQQIGEHFTLLKLQERFENLTFEPQFDAIYYDTFAPDTQPELWEQALFQSMYDALLPDGILVTYCAKGVVKRTLKSVGFEIEALKGPPGKREMTRAIKRS